MIILQVRGKKNLVLEKALAGPLNLLVKFSTLQEYGVDKPFFLENDNVDVSQRNVVFLVRGEKATTVMKVAGTFNPLFKRNSPDVQQTRSNGYEGRARSSMSFPSSGYQGAQSSQTNCLRKLASLVRLVSASGLCSLYL